MRFAVFTHVPHFQKKEEFLAYAPYVREMNLWFKHVEEVEVVAPRTRKKERSPGAPWGSSHGEAYEHSCLCFTAIPSFNFLSFSSSIIAIYKIPYIFFKILRAMKRADHLHLRCPGNIGLIACFCQIFFPNKPKTAKYAGNWDPEAKQPWSYKLQKWLVSNTFLTKNMKVLVYGEWPGQSRNIIPFFTASFSEKVLEEVREKTFEAPFTFLFVGNLVEGKQPIIAIEFVQHLREKLGENVIFGLEIYGEGPERKKLENYCRKNELNNLVHFSGNQPLEVLKEAHRKAHFLILPSRSEGWPKAVAEAMFFGCIPVATGVSFVPWMLNYGSRGILIRNIDEREENREKRGAVESRKWKVESRDGLGKVESGEGNSSAATEVDNQNVLQETVERIIELINDPEELRRMSMEAQEWSQQYTLERFEAAIQEVLKV